MSFGAKEAQASTQPLPVEAFGTSMDLVKLEEKVKQELKDQLESEYEANLLASDPVAYEKFMHERLDQGGADISDPESFEES